MDGRAFFIVGRVLSKEKEEGGGTKERVCEEPEPRSSSGIIELTLRVSSRFFDETVSLIMSLSFFL